MWVVGFSLPPDSKFHSSVPCGSVSAATSESGRVIVTCVIIRHVKPSDNKLHGNNPDLSQAHSNIT